MMRHIAFVVACTLALAGCDSSPSTPSPAACSFTLSATSVSMGASGGSGSVSVTTGSTCAWTASSGLSWVTATGGTSVTGPGTFTFMVAANAGSTARSGAVTVAGQSVTVTQQAQACTYTLQPPSRTFAAAGGAGTFEVSTQSGCAWTAEPAAAWLSIASGGSGSGNGTVTYQVAVNPDAASRAANIAVGGASHAVTQTGQDSCAVTLDRDHDTFPVSGGSGTVEITASSRCAWAATSDVPWMRVTDPAGGIGTGGYRLRYAVDANLGEASRVGNLTIGGKTVTITQTGTKTCTYSVAPVEFSACFGGLHDVTVTVTTGSGCGWTAAPAVSWLTLSSGASGSGPGSITFNVGTNYEAPPRQGNIEVRWPTPTAGQNVVVRQSGCFYSITPGTLAVPAAGGDYTVTVVGYSDNNACEGPLQDGCTWTPASSASWVTILNPGQHGGLDSLRLRVAANSGTARTGTITVRDKTLTITQAGL